MSLASRRLALLAFAVAGPTAMVLVPSAAADPDGVGKPAVAVIDELQQQGYRVEISGVPSGDTAMLTNCTVTAIHEPGDPNPDPTSATTVYVDVACPIRRG